jgi:TonB family protein
MPHKTLAAPRRLPFVVVVALPFIVNGSFACADTSTSGVPEMEHSTTGVRSYYPAPARRLGLTGRVGLEYSVDANGRPSGIVVADSAGKVLDNAAKQLLSDQHFTIPADWVATGGPEKRYRLGVIFQLTNKPKVPPFEDNRQTVVITVS